VTKADLYEQLTEASESHKATDARCTIVICHCRVRDFEQWKAGYERAVGADPEILGYRIWRGQDDHSLIVVEESHASRSRAELMFNHPATREAMERDGVDMSSVWLDYLDEIDSWAR